VVSRKPIGVETLTDFDPKKAKVNLAIEVTPPVVEFFLGGKSIATHHYNPDELRGRVGIYAYDAAAEFTGMRVLY
jgi:hypothetical protein